MYQKPDVERLGSLRELTKQTKWLGLNDGMSLGDNNNAPIGYRS